MNKPLKPVFEVVSDVKVELSAVSRAQEHKRQQQVQHDQLAFKGAR